MMSQVTRRLTRPILVVLGATGAGKSKLALELAQKFNGEIVNADAMQMYRGLDIITNKVTKEELALVKHHVIDFVDPLTTWTVVEYRNKALPVVEKLLADGVLPVICGGTAYYVESLLWKILIEQGSTDKEPVFAKCEADDGIIPTSELYERLKQIDPDRAAEIHPNERRKIIRSLQVFERTGKTHGTLLSEQRAQEGGSFLGGPLRFDNCHVIWVQCDQAVLDDRCNRRVDKMIERGLVAELETFHRECNKTRGVADYSVGIFQAIGFKEFHDYLSLTEEEKDTERGQKLFSEGVEQLKLVTRKYARKQLRWLKKRFLNPLRKSPKVYAVDSTHPENWDRDCHQPAVKIVQSILDGEEPEQQPLAFIHEPERQGPKRGFYCELCHMTLMGTEQLQAHNQGRKHRRHLKRAQTSDVNMQDKKLVTS